MFDWIENHVKMFIFDIIIFPTLFGTIISKVLTVMAKRWDALKLKTG